jgi:hypothetical protein
MTKVYRYLGNMGLFFIKYTRTFLINRFVKICKINGKTEDLELIGIKSFFIMFDQEYYPYYRALKNINLNIKPFYFKNHPLTSEFDHYNASS